METFAFYSYQGGVGRSVLTANAAGFLAALGRRVVALDFDFEAPSLHYKLRPPQSVQIQGGVVPYLVETAQGAVSPPPLAPHLMSIPVSTGWLRLMPAGPAPEPSYWAALRDLGERLNLRDSGGQGLLALLDLQARIQEELNPDYLLIDTRAGVTELGGLATTVLADTVVCILSPYPESLDGTLAVVEALTVAPRLKGQALLRVVPILSGAVGPLRDDPDASRAIARLVELGGERTGSGTKERALLSLPLEAEHARVAPSSLAVGAFAALAGSFIAAPGIGALLGPFLRQKRRLALHSYKDHFEIFEALFQLPPEVRTELEEARGEAGHGASRE